MPKPEWGTKRICPTTGERFYDLNRTPIVSPYTGQVVDLDSLTGRGRSMIADKAAVRNRDDQINDINDDEVLDDDSGDVDLDDDLLEDDEDDNVSLDEIADVAGGEDEG
ncbi:TIGR02300 family protein [Frigidibacter oleivorans]|uniref:TIGR02300 family protein n=1 Tax=Frigidibacter oleivorans TaxID=2487129 RepID=UPI000F8D20CC|nr:TIGR02300 family protein [Frigidibacter oleivorans]